MRIVTPLIIAAALWIPQVAHSANLVLLESDADAAGGSEVYLASYASLADLLADSPSAPTQFLPINVASGFSIGGFAYDGSYRLLLESDADAAGGSEVYLASYASLADFLADSPSAPTQFLPINVASGFSTVGYANVSSGAPVPEPATWMFMIAGFGIGGGAIRFAKRKRTGSLATALG